MNAQERRRRRKSERCRKGRERERESRGKKNVNIEQNRVQLTGQILEPMKQVGACACILFHSPSIFSISCAHARARILFFFQIYSLRHLERPVWVNIEENVCEREENRGLSMCEVLT